MVFSSPDLATLHADLSLKNQQIALMKETLKERDIRILQLEHQLAGMKRSRFGATSEASNQYPLLFEHNTQEDHATGNASPKEKVSTHAKKETPKRKALPPHLTRIDEPIELASPNCTVCGGDLHIIEHKVTEELDYIPARFVVRRIIRPRAVCRDCETMVQPPLPSRPIERGRPTASLLSHIIISKYADHLPLYRQSTMMKREEIHINRSTLEGWVSQSAALLAPLADAVKQHVLSGNAIFADDTVVNVMAPGKGKTATGRLWSYSRDERPFSGEAAPAVWYQFSPDRKGIHPKKHLKDYKGFMHADGYGGFNDLYRSGDIQEVACLAHCRRKFTDVLSSMPTSSLAAEAVKRMSELYAIEKEAKGLPPDKRVEIRQSQARPLFEDLQQWLGEQLPKLSRKTPLAVAIRYTIKRMEQLAHYLNHGQLEIDNNTAERSMRAIAVGRKNWLFAGSNKGGENAAILYSLIETAKLNNVNPQEWLTYVLGAISEHPNKHINQLMPWNYQQNS